MNNLKRKIYKNNTIYNNIKKIKYLGINQEEKTCKWKLQNTAEKKLKIT